MLNGDVNFQNFVLNLCVCLSISVFMTLPEAGFPFFGFCLHDYILIVTP
jgi:hypothetical protein